MSDKKRRWDKFSRSDNKESSSEDECDVKRKPSVLVSGPLPPSSYSTSRDLIGPALPPNFQNIASEPSSEIGPILPPHLRRIPPQDLSAHFEKSPSPPSEIGPILPPHLRRIPPQDLSVHIEKSPEPNCQNVASENSKSSPEPLLEIGPILPPHLQGIPANTHVVKSPVIGPVLPPHLRSVRNDLSPPVEMDLVQNNQPTDEIDSKSSPARIDKIDDIKERQPLQVGPVLPPHLIKSHDVASAGDVGPARPPHLQKSQPSTMREERILGPTLPPGFVPPTDSDSEDESFGPDPRLMHSGDLNMEEEVAARAERARRKMLGLDEKKVERESWMLELPPERAAIVGVTARQFRAKPAPEMGDRTVWTDTPTDAAKKVGLPAKPDDAALMRQAAIALRDKEMEKMARKAEKKAKRDQSLVDLHSKKMKKAAKEEAKKMDGKPVMRKMFSREDDMQVHKFDEAQKKAILKKAQMLDDRFSRGESKFL